MRESFVNEFDDTMRQISARTGNPEHSSVTTSTHQEAFLTTKSHEHDGVPNDWDIIDKANKYHHEIDRVERYASYGRTAPEPIRTVDPEYQTGFVLQQNVPEIVEQLGVSDERLIKQRTDALNRGGICSSSDAVWSSMQHRALACPSTYAEQTSELHTQEAHHLGRTQASVDTDFSVGSILHRFKYEDETNGGLV